MANDIICVRRAYDSWCTALAMVSFRLAIVICFNCLIKTDWSITPHYIRILKRPLQVASARISMTSITLAFDCYSFSSLVLREEAKNLSFSFVFFGRYNWWHNATATPHQMMWHPLKSTNFDDEDDDDKHNNNNNSNKNSNSFAFFQVVSRWFDDFETIVLIVQIDHT